MGDEQFQEPQYYSRAVSPYSTFIVGTDQSVLAVWQQYRPIGAVWLAQTVDATFEFRLHDCDKGLLPTIQMWFHRIFFNFRV